MAKDIKTLIRKAISLNVITGEDSEFVFDEIVLGESKQDVERFLSKNKKIVTAVARAVQSAEVDEANEDNREEEDDLEYEEEDDLEYEEEDDLEYEEEDDDE